MAAKLKVFQARMGFHETVVAAPSRRAALEAWGTRQDLFGEGLAGTTDDAAAVKVALAAPGVVLSRAAGSKGAFAPVGEGTGELPDVPRAKPPAKAKDAPKAKRAPKRADRSRLDAAEAALREAELEHAAALKAMAQERAALDGRELDLRRDWDKDRRALERSRDAAETAYRKAGGEN